MAAEDDDLYDEEYEFVDEEDDEEEVAEDDASDGDDTDDDESDEKDSDKKGGTKKERDKKDGDKEEGDEVVDEYGRPEPIANYVVHVYEYTKFKRTLDREFTPEDAEAFATDYNRTAKNYGRVAVPGKNDAKPKKTLA